MSFSGTFAALERHTGLFRLLWTLSVCMNSRREWTKTPLLNTWSNKYIIKDIESIWPYIKNGCRAFRGNSTYAYPSPLPIHPPEAIARGHHERWDSLHLRPDPGHAPLHWTRHLEQTGKNCYPVLLRWGVRNKATQQICGKLGLQTSCPKPTQVIFPLSMEHTKGIWGKESLQKHTTSGGAEILNESEPSITLRGIPLQFVCLKVFTASPTTLHTSCCCSFRQLVTCLLSKCYLLLTRSQGDSIKKSEKQSHCSQGGKEFLLRYSLPCVLLSCM